MEVDDESRRRLLVAVDADGDALDRGVFDARDLHVAREREVTPRQFEDLGVEGVEDRVPLRVGLEELLHPRIEHAFVVGRVMAVPLRRMSRQGTWATD